MLGISYIYCSSTIFIFLFLFLFLLILYYMMIMIGLSLFATNLNSTNYFVSLRKFHFNKKINFIKKVIVKNIYF